MISATLIARCLSISICLGTIAIPALCQGQAKQGVRETVITVNLKQQQIGTPGRGITRLFQLGPDDDTMTVLGKEHRFIRPQSLQSKELGFFRIYFVGRKGAVQNAIMVLVSEFDSDRPEFFVDHNNNLDFSDDPRTDAFKGKAKYPVITVQGDDRLSEFSLQLMPVRTDSELTKENKARYRKVFGSNQGEGVQLADFDCWYFNQRLNNKTGQVQLGKHSVMLAAHDYDCDGLYNGDRDRLLIGPGDAKTVSDRFADGAVLAKAGEIFMAGKVPFEIVEVSPTGAFVRVRRTDKQPNRLFVGDQLPNMDIKMFSGESKKLRSLLVPNKYLLLDFWGHWCAPCLHEIPRTIEFQKRWKEKIHLVGVHYGEHDVARKIVKEKGVKWDQAEFNDELKKQLFIDGWPTYVLIAPDGTILSFKTTLKALESRLSEESD